jgi:membrane AbrB-like protein
VAVRLGIPIGAIMGALTATVVVQGLGLTSVEPFPPWARNILYVTIGFMIGLRVTRSSLRKLRGVALPAFLVPAVMITCGLLLGLLYAALAPNDSPLHLDFQSAVLAITPGGFQEMSIAAQQMNALLSVVVISHVIRIMTVLFAYPKIIRTALGYIERRSPSADGESQDHSSDEGESPPKDRVGPARWAAMILGAAAGGVFGVWTSIPAGSVVFAMLGVALVKTVVAAESAAFPTFARRGVQIALGTTLGLQVSLRPLARAGDLVIPLATTLALLLVISLATGLFIYRFTRMDLASALWMSAPGGLMEIMVLAEAMDLDVLPILTVHTMRVLLIIAIQPSLVLALSNAL